MKRITLLLLFVSTLSFSQIFNPVKWETSVEKISEKEYYLVTKAVIEKNWKIYAQKVEKNGPNPTIFSYNTTDDYELIGKTSEEKGITSFDKTFGMTIKYFKKSAVFKQKIKLLSEKTEISAEVEFMACDDAQCLPPTTEPLVFRVPTNDIIVTDTQNSNNKVEISDKETNMLLYGITKDNFKQPIASDNSFENNEVTEKEEKTLFSIFILGFLGGLLALLTPCVFPMIPLSVSFFTKQGESKKKGVYNAFIYGFFILAVYLLLSIPFHLLDSINPDILNEISTDVRLNIIFFVIFIFFAGSFFGFYELTLPSSWTNKTTEGESSGGIIGIFFMALTLAIVSFSCTGPILGSLLAGSLSSDGGAWQLTAGMAGFGVALGLPFTVFALFPNMMKSLPRSGGWMNSVKVVLGFLELALAFKFLSNADLVKNWGILKFETFLVIWIIVFTGLALYLLGRIKFPHDSKIQKLSFPRIGLGILTFSFVIYLATGFMKNEDTGTYKPLGGILSGLTPPVTYSIFNSNKCPNNLNCFKDLKEGLAYAKKVNKPIILDFSGYACVNCRKMEEDVWTDKKVDNVLRNDFVLISLYVDDKKELPKEEQILVNRINGGTRKLENYGHKWSHFQTVFFKQNSQPFYILLNSDGKQILNKPIGYTPEASNFLKWLNHGKEQIKAETNIFSIPAN